MKRRVIRVVKRRKSVKVRMKNSLPMVRRPGKVYGCWERREERAPVDIVISNHDQVKCSRRLRRVT